MCAIDLRSQSLTLNERERGEGIIERSGKRMFGREAVIKPKHGTSRRHSKIPHRAIMGINGPESPTAAMHKHDQRQHRVAVRVVEAAAHGARRTRDLDLPGGDSRRARAPRDGSGVGEARASAIGMVLKSIAGAAARSARMRAI